MKGKLCSYLGMVDIEMRAKFEKLMPCTFLEMGKDIPVGGTGSALLCLHFPWCLVSPARNSPTTLISTLSSTSFSECLFVPQFPWFVSFVMTQ